MTDKDINSQKEFFEEVRLDSEGNFLISKGYKSGVEKICKTKYEFFKSVKLDAKGNLKVYK